MAILSAVEKYLEKYNRWLLVFFMTLIALLVTVQVILRYVLSLPMHFTEELLTFCAVWVYLLGSVNASRTETHINARILEIFCKRPEQIKRIRAVSAAISTIVLLWLTYWAYDFLAYSLRRGKISQILGYPLVLAECAMFICIILMTAYSLAECVRYCRKTTIVREEGVR